MFHWTRFSKTPQDKLEMLFRAIHETDVSQKFWDALGQEWRSIEVVWTLAPAERLKVIRHHFLDTFETYYRVNDGIPVSEVMEYFAHKVYIPSVPETMLYALLNRVNPWYWEPRARTGCVDIHGRPSRESLSALTARLQDLLDS